MKEGLTIKPLGDGKFSLAYNSQGLTKAMPDIEAALSAIREFFSPSTLPTR